MAARDPEVLALEVVEHAAAANDRDALLSGLFSLLSGEVGFDSASVTAPASSDIFTWNKPEQCAHAWRVRAARYMREGAPAFAAAARSQGVVHDLDVFTRDVRSRSSFYAEYVRPLGARSIALVVVSAGGVASHTLSFSRHGKAFRARDLDVLRAIRAALSLAVRVCAPAALTASTSGLPLTRREAEVAGYVARGLQNAEIAALCGSSPFTVRNQLAAIFRKLEVTTRAELVARLFEGRSG